MTYYALITSDIAGTYGSGVTKLGITTTLRNTGVQRFAALDGFIRERRTDARKTDPSALKLPYGHTLLLGTDRASRDTVRNDIYSFCGPLNIDRVELDKPKPNEWMACVTFVEPDQGTPTFQVIGCVGASTLKAAGVNWTQEDKPPQLWASHAVYQQPAPLKVLSDITSFTGKSGW